jgi:hypothetical protein
MKNLVKLSIFAIALGFFASCSDAKEETPAAETPAVETPAPTPAPAADTMAPAATTEAPAADTTKK